MNISTKREGSCLFIGLDGRLDTTTVPELEMVINTSLIGIDQVVIDAKRLAYISSAGLRAFLKLKKLVDNTKIIEVSNEVFDILQMTGFSEIIDIQRAFREISVEGCKIIGKGACGTVYRIAPDAIVKVFTLGTTLETINREKSLAKKAFVLGVPTAIAYDVVKVGECYGAIFELLEAQTLSTLIQQNPDNLENYIHQYAEVLKTIHSSELRPGELTNIKNEVSPWLKNITNTLTESNAKKLVEMFNNINEDDHMLHGDYHIKNLMVQNNEPFIIDMDTLAQGSPIFEYAFMYSCYIGYQELHPEHGKDFFGVETEILKKIFYGTIRYVYPNLTDEEFDKFIIKCRIISYIQLIDRFTRNQDHLDLRDHMIKSMNEIIPLVDDLNV